MNEINIIRNNYNDIKFIFDFFDRFALKLKKVSLEEKTDETTVFEDHYNKDISYVSAKNVNKILDYCYNEYFFKIVLSGSLYYQQIKKISDSLEIEPYYYDLFFRSFFLAIKDRYYSSENYDYNYNKILVLRIVLGAHSESFGDLPVIDFETYRVKATLLLKEIEKAKLVFYSHNDITQNFRLRSYFPISCDTFKFEITKETKGYEKSIPMLDFLDLKRFLDNSEILDYNLLSRMDRAVHTLVVLSFHDLKFKDNPHSDNSYIKKLRLEKQLVEKKKREIDA